MAYPGKPKQEDPMSDAAPQVPSSAATGVPPVQVPGVTGGAPRLTNRPAGLGRDGLARAWGATGTPDAVYERTRQRMTTGVDPGVIVDSLRQYWTGTAQRGERRPPLSAPVLPLAEAQDYLKDLSSQLKLALDERLKSVPEAERSSSRFWRGYQEFPEQMSALVARRLFTNKMVASGPVADWLKWLGG